METIDEVIKAAFFFTLGIHPNRRESEFKRVMNKNGATPERVNKYLTPGFLKDAFPLDDFSLKALKVYNFL